MAQNLKPNRSDNRGGKRENSGAKKLTYVSKTIFKRVPEEIHDYCLSLIDAEVQKYKLKNNKK